MSRKTSPATQNAAPSTLEQLEGRRLLSASFLVPAVHPITAFADVNGDGKADEVICQNNLRVSITPNGIQRAREAALRVRLGKGDGTFGPASFGLLLPAVQVADVVTGDFDGDGSVDVAVVEGSASTHPGGVNILRGTGKGTFLSPNLAGQFSGGVRNLMVGDVNGDGTPDLISNQNGIIAILIGLLRPSEAGPGTFSFAKEIDIQSPYAGQNVRNMAAGDLNGDGKVDLAVAMGDGSVRVAMGDGSVFKDVGVVRGCDGSVRVAVGDVNGDGRADVIAMCDGSVRVAESDGQGGLLPAVQSPLRVPAIIAINTQTADVNGDGKLDLIFTDFFGGPHVFGYGQKDGTFANTIGGTGGPDQLLG